jgi:hypothetical protein
VAEKQPQSTLVPLDEQMCDNCRFRRVSDNGGAECHRHAPAAQVGQWIPSYWPMVCGHDWCGEWAPEPLQQVK